MCILDKNQDRQGFPRINPVRYVGYYFGLEAHHRWDREVICDYIAGMTDPFFLRTYQRARDQK